MIHTLMEEYKFNFDENFGLFYHDHCIVSRHQDKPDQPILLRDLQFRFSLKLNNATLHKIIVIIEVKLSITPRLVLR